MKKTSARKHGLSRPAGPAPGRGKAAARVGDLKEPRGSTHARTEDDTMRAEYDFRGGVRGKHHAKYGEGTNLVVLEADVADVFRDSGAVNEALRTLIRLNKSERTRAAKG